MRAATGIHGSESAALNEYNIFRWYRAGWGRYTQADPTGLAAGLNLFAYVKGNPVAVADPYGLVPVSYQGASNSQIQIDCKSATALGCTLFDYNLPTCSCSQGCDTVSKKTVWVANPTFNSKIRVYFSTDCYDTGRIIMEEERHVAIWQEATGKIEDKAAALRRAKFSSKERCEGACFSWLSSAYGILANAKSSNDLIDRLTPLPFLGHPDKNCAGKWNGLW